MYIYIYIYIYISDMLYIHMLFNSRRNGPPCSHPGSGQPQSSAGPARSRLAADLYISIYQYIYIYVDI